LAADQALFTVQTKLGKLYRLTGIEFRAGSRTKSFGKGCVVVTGDTKTFRIDNCKFDGIRNRPVVIRNAACGVIDHNLFFSQSKSQQITIFHDKWGGGDWGDGSWSTPIDWGGPNAVYIEDNIFAASSANSGGVLDEYGGARFVFRHNRVTNAVVASHGTGSTGRFRSVRHWEIYNNLFVAEPKTSKNAIHMRGGTGVVFSNTVVGFSKFLTLHTYRFHSAFRMWSGSDGTSGWDLNDPKIYVAGKAGEGSGAGPNGTGGKLVVPGVNWRANEWVGFAIKNLDGLGNVQPQGTRGPQHGPGPFFSTVLSNTSDTIVIKAGSRQPDKIFRAGDRFEIRRVIQSLDMVGASTGELLSGGSPTPRWLKQSIEPVYIWNNTINGQNKVPVATAHPPITEGVHFVNNRSKPGYKPFVYPHPISIRDLNQTPHP
jgi:hypothetical protein